MPRCTLSNPSASSVSMTASLTFVALAALVILDTLRTTWAISKTTISHVRFAYAVGNSRPWSQFFSMSSSSWYLVVFLFFFTNNNPAGHPTPLIQRCAFVVHLDTTQLCNPMHHVFACPEPKRLSKPCADSQKTIRGPATLARPL
ncbi:hypothetical protein BDP81DRAFT_203391 [Colletotrichum phormii]|uniref:Uncharacterized protein n=1 Tax=Colletotrichum phormii TaxID=359342 RepID=A0AAI9ZU50_9PEZI|nr:uncharacterized protein BDP81DRAFT_203391 [Colletotrichum phormii]KAK1638188.1 hypothetical protein BDP81DRAFT_203391 [Colletotrichum phormii]